MEDAHRPLVLFICTGNYYRSRFAEALFNHLAAARGTDWRAFSRGVHIELAPPGLSQHTTLELRARAIPPHHTTGDRTALAPTDLQHADRIVALKEAEHRAYLQRDFPTWVDRVTYWHFHDLDCAGPAEVLPAIADAVERLLNELTTASSGQGTH